MSDPGIQQRLAAILAADAVGYSKLTAQDERGALAALDAARGVFRLAIESHTGRVIDMAGDSVLAVFETVTGAVRAAIAAQRNLPGPLQYRIGVHLGDVIAKSDGSIYGDGVNVAARLQALGAPGAVVISDLVHGAVQMKLDASFRELGTHKVKNMERPITAFAVETGVAAKRAAEQPASTRASVAVLPFDNMSGDTTQTYIADGLSEDLITALSKYHGLRVPARNSSFVYKGRSVDVRQIARDLGVQYVVEGSVRKAGNRLRVTAQLIDGASGDHIWSERYDRDLQDLFSLQDEIVTIIAARLEPEVANVEVLRAMRKPTESLGAWDCYHLALHNVYRFTREGNSEAERLFRRAIEFDPRFALAHARLAYCQILDMVYYDAPASPQALDEALQLCKKAVELDPADGYCQLALGRVHIARREYELGIAACEAGLRLNPNMGVAYCGVGDALAYAGRPKDAINCFEEAVRLSPTDPWRWAFYAYGALAHIFLGEYDQAVDWAQKAILVPNCQYWAQAHLAVALAHLGREAEAARALAEVRKANPRFSLEYARNQLFYLDRSDQIERYLEGLRRAGAS